jgi:hypothetical protein
MKHRLGWSRRKWSVSLSREFLGTSFAMVHLDTHESASPDGQREDAHTKNRRLGVMSSMSGEPVHDETIVNIQDRLWMAVSYNNAR